MQCSVAELPTPISPSDCVLKALHLVGDVLKVPECLPGLLHVCVLELRHHLAPDNLVGVRLQHDVATGDVHLEHRVARHGALVCAQPGEAALDDNLGLIPTSDVWSLVNCQVEAFLGN